MATAESVTTPKPASNLRNYVLVTLAYWADTLTDGAIRMLVLLYFYKEQGYTAIQVSMLFLFYEVFGIVTNFVGGWIAARLGLKATLFSGLGMQLVALTMLPIETTTRFPNVDAVIPKPDRSATRWYVSPEEAPALTTMLDKLAAILGGSFYVSAFLCLVMAVLNALWPGSGALFGALVISPYFFWLGWRQRRARPGL